MYKKLNKCAVKHALARAVTGSDDIKLSVNVSPNKPLVTDLPQGGTLHVRLFLELTQAFRGEKLDILIRNLPQPLEIAPKASLWRGILRQGPRGGIVEIQASQYNMVDIF